MTRLTVGERADRMVEHRAGLLRTVDGRKVANAAAAVREAVAARFLRRTVAITTTEGVTYRGRVAHFPIAITGRHCPRMLVLERPEYVALAFHLGKIDSIAEEAR